jgi:hypothetical protein
VLLFVEQALHEEAIDGQRRVGGHPGLNRGQRNREQLGVEPGARLLLPREQDLHLLPAPVDGVVAQVFVVLQRGEVPHPVAQRAQRIHGAQRLEEARTRLAERALELPERFDQLLELGVARGPLVPAVAHR